MRYELRKTSDHWLYRELVRIDDDGSETVLGSDGGEPEDQTFYRDWKWVPEELNRLADIISRGNNDY